MTSNSVYQDTVFIPTPSGYKLECFFGVDGWEPVFCFPTFGFVKVVYPAFVSFFHKESVDFRLYDVERAAWQFILKNMRFFVLPFGSNLC